MPDALRKTISATEAPALFNASPYVTLWMLYQRFKNAVDIDPEEDNRMSWGTKLEPLVLAQTAEDHKLIVAPNIGPDGKQVYLRNGLLGCTRDATILKPDKGPGVCDAKCVFDYSVWMQRWGGGDAVPREIETQIQVQMLVGDGQESYSWGIIPVWVCGEMHYFEREPIPKLWQSLKDEAARFFDDVANSNEPEPFGSPVELAILRECFPLQEGLVLDMSQCTDEKEKIIADRLAEKCRMLEWHAAERLGHDRAEKALKAEFLTFAGPHGEVRLPHGIKITVKESPRAGYTVKPSVSRSPKVFVPEGIDDGALEF